MPLCTSAVYYIRWWLRWVFVLYSLCYHSYSSWHLDLLLLLDNAIKLSTTLGDNWGLLFFLVGYGSCALKFNTNAYISVQTLCFSLPLHTITLLVHIFIILDIAYDQNNINRSSYFCRIWQVWWNKLDCLEGEHINSHWIKGAGRLPQWFHHQSTLKPTFINHNYSKIPSFS